MYLGTCIILSLTCFNYIGYVEVMTEIVLPLLCHGPCQLEEGFDLILVKMGYVFVSSFLGYSILAWKSCLHTLTVLYLCLLWLALLFNHYLLNCYWWLLLSLETSILLFCYLQLHSLYYWVLDFVNFRKEFVCGQTIIKIEIWIWKMLVAELFYEARLKKRGCYSALKLVWDFPVNLLRPLFVLNIRSYE